MEKQYNELFNSIRPREYDGRHIVFGGINPEITLREHQLNAIAHVLYGGNTLLAHEVGAGKTFEMVAAAMESKRLGLCQKSLFAVPNHLIEQWASEFLRLYPTANILVASKKDFEGRNRKSSVPVSPPGIMTRSSWAIRSLNGSPFPMSGGNSYSRTRFWRLNRALRNWRTAARRDSASSSWSAQSVPWRPVWKSSTTPAEKDSSVTFEQLGVDRSLYRRGTFL